ncbi:MAG: hypothetical protein ACXVCY_06405 [Pseudobdellovibrionaceae bacterium]
MKAFISLLMFMVVWDAHGAMGHHGQSKREIPVSSSHSLSQQVDTYIELLEKEVNVSKTNKERFQSLNRVIHEIKSLRDNSIPQGAWDDSHLDLLVTVLESLPSEKKFNKKDCAKYENDLLSQFEPQAEEAPEEPAVKPAWTVLQSLCR